MGNKIKLLLIGIIIIGLSLRIVSLDKHPVSLAWDEVAVGYNAYTISEIGTDEYGISYPLLFLSLNDFRLPGYIYLDAFFIKLLGLSDFTVRLPSALFGTLSIFFVFILFSKIFSQKVGLISAFLMAVSPWSLQLSRGAFEANVALSVTLLGIILLYYGLKNKIAAILSIPIITSTIYFYYSQRLIVPLLIIVFFFIFRKKLGKNLKYYIFGFLIAFILTLPMIIQILGPHGFKRINEVSIFSDKSIEFDYILAREKNSENPVDFLVNRRIPYVITAAHNYFQHFSPGFLFFGDDPNPRHRAYPHGLFYLIEIPLLIFGALLLLNSKKREEKIFIFAWIVIAPLTSALSREAPHGVRSLLLLPPLIFLIAYATENIIARNKRFLIPLAVCYLIFIVNYIVAYYFVYPVQSNNWAFGYKQMYQKVFQLEKNYDQIIVTGDLWKPRIFYQYYKKELPQKIEKKDNFEILGKYYFAPTFWDGGLTWSVTGLEKTPGKKLIVLSKKEFEENKENNLVIIDEVKDYSGRNTVFVITQSENTN